MDRTNKTEIGARAEDLALAYLERRGLKLLVRNYRCRGGELDLIMLDGSIIALVEVRMRSSSLFGGAAASVTPAKQRRMILAARHLMLTRKDIAAHRMRFDVLAIDRAADGAERIEWMRAAFSSHP